MQKLIIYLLTWKKKTAAKTAAKSKKPTRIRKMPKAKPKVKPNPTKRRRRTAPAKISQTTADSS